RRQSLNIVDYGRRRIKTGDSREGRFHARMTAESFQRTQQRSLFTTDVGTGSSVRVDLAGEVCAENIVADETSSTSFLDRHIHDVDQVFVLATGVDVGEL